MTRTWPFSPRRQVLARRRTRALGRRPLERLEDRALLSALSLTVNSLGDSGAGLGTAGDLRFCVAQANLHPGSTIGFAGGLTGTIALGSGLELKASTTINGPSALSLTLQGVGRPPSSASSTASSPWTVARPSRSRG
jgi:hypothetical protein